jgi:triosephosphate isomerase
VRAPLIIGNWKMNLDVVEAVHLTQQVAVLVRADPPEHAEVVLAPPFVDLRSVASVIAADRLDVGLGAQHANPHESGAHTGEVSVAMLRRLGVAWVLVGHSERRTHYHMDDEAVAATLRAVSAGGLRAVLCVGEDEAVREAGDHGAFVEAQLRSALAGLPVGARESVSVAYEPIWAIGTGRTAQVEQVAEMAGVIRGVLAGFEMGEARVLYGGSVSPANAAELSEGGAMDGFLVGGASLAAESFLAIVRAADGCYAAKR